MNKQRPIPPQLRSVAKRLLDTKVLDGHLGDGEAWPVDTLRELVGKKKPPGWQEIKDDYWLVVLTFNHFEKY